MMSMTRSVDEVVGVGVVKDVVDVAMAEVVVDGETSIVDEGIEGIVEDGGVFDTVEAVCKLKKEI